MMASIGDEDGLYSMSRHHRQVLNQCRTFLIRNLDVKPIVDEFVTLGLISNHQEEALMVSKTSTELVRHFCSLLPKLGPTAYLSFLEALKNTNQGHVQEYVESMDIQNDSVTHRPSSHVIRKMAEEQGDAPMSQSGSHSQSVYDFITPSKTRQHDDKPKLESYRMRGGRYVNVLIINNETFSAKSLSCRYGSSQDVKNLEELFNTVLNFNVQTITDMTAANMRLKLTVFSKEEIHANSDACIVVIMSHGGNGLIYGTDGERISIRDVMELFGADNCKSLIDKPKYFIFQSCRGEHKETGVDRTDAASSEEMTVSIETHPLARSPHDEMKYIPSMVDTLVSYATLPGYVSWRNSENGSWFIQAFCSVFKTQSAVHSVMKMLAMVTHEMVEKYGSSYVQLCEHTTRLRRDFCLTASAT